jgi:uncharacterized protein with GYD domain
MPYYLTQVGYTPESWAAQMKSQQDVRERVGPAAEAIGGRIDSVFYSFGEHDLIAIVEFPNDAAVAAWSIATSAGGALRSLKTTPFDQRRGRPGRPARCVNGDRGLPGPPLTTP